MTDKDRREFREYLKACTDRQVRGVYEKESAAGRRGYARMARTELEIRGLD